MIPALEFRFFGNFLVTPNHAPLRKLPPHRTALLLAFLMLKPPATPVSRGTLAATLWPDDLDEDAKSNLRRHIHMINAAFPTSDVPWFDSTRLTVAWNPSAPTWADIVAFKELSSRPDGFEAAIELYRGDLLEGWEDEWILQQREVMRATYLSMCYDVAQAARRARDFDRALQYLARILALDEWREDVVRLTMMIRHEAGDRAGALSYFQDFSTRLKAEMHVAPMAETLALREALFQNTLENRGAPASDTVVRLAAPVRAFVGRSHELEALETAWTKAAHGRGSTLLVGGVAGIGKSSLVSQLVALAQEQGGRVMFGTTSSPEAFPYEPIVLALRAALPLILEARIDRTWLASLARILPELRGTRDDLDQRGELSPEDARERLTESVIRTILALSRARPLVLVVEDIHWAAHETLAMLETLARRIGALPILLVLTFRSDESNASQAVSALRRRLQMEHHASTLTLSNLTEAEVGELVSAVTSADRGALLQSMYELSEGHPLFISQLLQRYHEDGGMPNRDGALVTLDDAIGERIAQLDERSQRVAEAAAVVGSAFSVEIVARVLGWSERDVLEALDTLFDRSVVRETGMREYAYMFTHALIQSSIYQRIAPVLLAARHRRVATVLQQMDADHQGADIARHWEAAGEQVLAHDAYLRAARAAFAVFALDSARSAARKAATLADGDRGRFEALAVLVRGCQGNAHAHELERSVSEMEAVASRLSDEERFAAAEERVNVSVQLGHREERVRAIDLMLSLGHAARDPRKLATALCAAGSLAQFEGDAPVARAHFAEAVREATGAGDPALLLQVRMAYAQLLSMSGEHEAAMALLADARRGASATDYAAQSLLLRCEATIAYDTADAALAARVGSDLIALAETLGNVDLKGRGHSLLGTAAVSTNDPSTARREFSKAIALHESTAHRYLLAATTMNLGGTEYVVGRFPEATALLLRAGELAREVGSSASLGFSLGCLAEMARDLGDIERARSLIDECFSAINEAGDVRLLALVRITRGSIIMRQGDVATGKAEMRDAIAARRETGRSAGVLASHYCTVIETALHVDDMDFLHEGTTQLLEIDAQGLVPLRERVRAAIALARAAVAEETPDAAQRVEAAARAVQEHIGRFQEPADREAYLAQPFVRALPEVVA